MMKRFVLAVLVVMIGVVGCGRGGEIAPPTGKILLVDNRPSPEHQVLQYDVVSGETESLFTAPDFTQIHQIAVDDGEETLYVTYTPPPTVDSGFFDRSGLYALDLVGGDGELRDLLGGSLSQEFYLQQAVSGDGRWLYYAHFAPDFVGGVTQFAIAIERLGLEDGVVELVALDGNWPILAPGGARMAYVQIDAATQERALVTADLEGQDRTTLIPFGMFFDIDLPLYSPDGAWLYFTTVAERPQVRGFWDAVLGVSVAEAHSDLPSLWWRIPAGGGEAEQVSREPVVIYAGSFSADGEYLAYSSAVGLHLMTKEGSEGAAVPFEALGDVVWLGEE